MNTDDLDKSLDMESKPKFDVDQFNALLKRRQFAMETWDWTDGSLAVVFLVIAVLGHYTSSRPFIWIAIGAGTLLVGSIFLRMVIRKFLDYIDAGRYDPDIFEGERLSHPIRFSKRGRFIESNKAYRRFDLVICDEHEMTWPAHKVVLIPDWRLTHPHRPPVQVGMVYVVKRDITIEDYAKSRRVAEEKIPLAVAAGTWHPRRGRFAHFRLFRNPRWKSLFVLSCTVLLIVQLIFHVESL